MLATVASCTVTPFETQPFDTSFEPLPFEQDVFQLTSLRLSPDLREDAGSRALDYTGLVLALLESGLSEVRHLLPKIEAAPPTPGLSAWSFDEPLAWRAQVQADEAEGILSARVRLCSPSGTCDDREVSAPVLAFAPALAPLYQAMAKQMGHTPLANAETTWRQPLSEDAYALLVTGRAAASFYGLLPAVDAASVGDKQRDPIARAVFLDPELEIAQWIFGRRALAQGLVDDARQAFTRAALGGGDRVLFRADEAAALASLGGQDAPRAWENARRLVPDDIRFLPGHAMALIQVGTWEAALALLDAMPARYQQNAAVLPLRVRIAENGVGRESYEALLEEWERVATSHPEPLRRHIRLLVREQRLAEALAHTDRLAAVGQPQEAAQLAMALAVGVRDWPLALAKADEAALQRASVDIRARAALEQDPTQVPPELLGAESPLPLLARAAAHLSGSRFAKALGDANRVLLLKPWMPEALALRARALWGLGRAAAAQAAEAQLRFSDPEWPQDLGLPPYGPTDASAKQKGAAGEMPTATPAVMPAL
ncbi:MAG: hypothetical protein ACKVPX_09480 [Myxococcaceae bacterium]